MSRLVSSSSTSPQVAVVVGAGFAGLSCALELARTPHFHVLLVDWKDYFEFTPGALRAVFALSDRTPFEEVEQRSCCCPSSPPSKAVPHKKLNARSWYIVLSRLCEREGVEFRHAEVLRFGSSHSLIVRRNETGISTGDEIPFDFCVLATGCAYNTACFWKPDPQRGVFTSVSPARSSGRSSVREPPNASVPPSPNDTSPNKINTLETDEQMVHQTTGNNPATTLRTRVAELQYNCDFLDDLNVRGTAVCVRGAGLVGVEWLAELLHFCPNLKITHEIRESGMLPASKCPSAHRYVKDHWKRGGVSVRVAPASKSSSGGPEIKVEKWKDRAKEQEILFDCTGFSREPLPYVALSAQFLATSNGRLLTDRSLRVRRGSAAPHSTDSGTRPTLVWSHIFACGDNALMSEFNSKSEEFPRAQNAYSSETGAALVVHNIRAAVDRGGGRSKGLDSEDENAFLIDVDGEGAEGTGAEKNSAPAYGNLVVASGRGVLSEQRKASSSSSSSCCRRRRKTLSVTENLFSSITLVSLGPNDGLFLLKWPCRRRHSVFLWGRCAVWFKDFIQRSKMAAYRGYCCHKSLWGCVPHY